MAVRRMETDAGEPAVVLEAGMNCGTASWQRVMRAVHPDETHGDAAASDAAIRELRAAATCGGSLSEHSPRSSGRAGAGVSSAVGHELNRTA
jgi:hypothetical protein